MNLGQCCPVYHLWMHLNSVLWIPVKYMEHMLSKGFQVQSTTTASYGVEDSLLVSTESPFVHSILVKKPKKLIKHAFSKLCTSNFSSNGHRVPQQRTQVLLPQWITCLFDGLGLIQISFASTSNGKKPIDGPKSRIKTFHTIIKTWVSCPSKTWIKTVLNMQIKLFSGRNSHLLQDKGH